MNKIVLLLAALMPHPASLAAASGPLVGGGEREYRQSLPQWSRVMEAVTAEQAAYAACEAAPERCAVPAIADWSRLIDGLRGSSRARQIRAVNSFVNRQAYGSDATLWSRSDHWATPLEFLTRAGGDCEDYAITKYVSLRRLGMTAEELRLLVVRDTRRNLDHAVLAARDATAWSVLDNLHDAVVPQAEAVAYAPYYAVNEAALWAYVTPPAASSVPAGAR